MGVTRRASELFGTSTGDLTADRIKLAIEQSKDGLSRDQIRGLFHGHVSRDRIEAALEQLISLGVLTHHLQPGRGRPASVWSAIPDAEEIDRATAQEGPYRAYRAYRAYFPDAWNLGAAQTRARSKTHLSAK